MKDLHKSLLTAGALAALTVSAQAATISWGSATLISADTNVSTNGSLVEAYNLNGNAVTLNGVSFATTGTVITDNTTEVVGTFAIGATTTLTPNLGATRTLYRDVEFANGPAAPAGAFAALSANYQSLLQGGVLALGPGTSNTNGGGYTLTFSNLTIGSTYEVQIWTNDSRSATGRSQTLDGTVLLDHSNTDATVGGVGQWVVGSFVADATTQSLSMDAPGTVGSATAPNNAPILNAYQLRDITPVPEPSVALLGGLGALALMRRRRA